MIKVIAGKYGWVTFDPKMWYKGQMNNPLLRLEKWKTVWVKVNTEIPERGRTFWILGASSKFMHLSDEMLGEYVTLVLQGNKPVASTIDEAKKLNGILDTVLVEVRHERERAKRIGDKEGVMDKPFIGKRAKHMKKNPGQGDLF